MKFTIRTSLKPESKQFRNNVDEFIFASDVSLLAIKNNKKNIDIITEKDVIIKDVPSECNENKYYICLKN